MLAAGRSWAGGLMIVVAPALAGCSSLSLPIPIPGFGPAALPPGMEPGIVQASTAPPESERPEFFVQWKPGLPGLTRRPAIDKNTPLPKYPDAAVRNEEMGRTTLEACLTADGRLVDTRLIASSGSTTLDDATIEWAKTAKYQPAEFNGEPFAICGYQFDYEWRVEVKQR